MRATSSRVLACLALLLGVLVGAPASQAATVTIVVDNTAFTPEVKTVAQGTTVTWDFRESGHNTVSRQEFWHSPILAAGHTYSVVISNAGRFGFPASTLTDNGRVYTARFGGGKNAFEYLLAILGITQKNGHPGHPQTQGKIERFHQTLKTWLSQQPAAHTVTELQHQLYQFRDLYNEQRPHRARHRSTPGQTYRTLPKAEPSGPRAPGHYRLRYDRLDTLGKMSFRRAGRMHHLGIGATHARKRVLAIADDTTVTVIELELETSEILSTHHIEPTKTYWRNQQKDPGRWPGSIS